MQSPPKQFLFDRLTADYVEQIAAENSTQVLEELGLRCRRNGSVKGRCPIHDGDNKSSFSFYPKKKIWWCWTNHCHEKYGCGLIGLIRSIQECTFSEAVQFLVDLLKIDLSKANLAEIERSKFIGRKRRIKTLDRVYDSKILDNFKNTHTPMFLGLGFRPNTLREFRTFVSTNEGKSLFGRECIPIFDVQDRLVGIGGKTATPSEFNRKWLYFPEGFALKRHLFCFNKAKPHIQETGVAILVEDCLSAMRLWESGIRNVVSTFSNKISLEQIKLLTACGTKKIIILFDPDKGGDAGVESVLNHCKLFFQIEDWRHLIDKDPKNIPVNKLRETIGKRLLQEKCIQKLF